MSLYKSSGSGDGDWKYRLYFDPEADQTSGKEYYLKKDQLKDRLFELIDIYQTIQQIFVYKTPLSESQWTSLFLHHKYIVFETSCWWWSFQKNDQYLVIQRSKNISYVRDYYRREKRCKSTYWKPQLIKKDKGRYNLRKLIQWMVEKDLLGQTYFWLTKNCKHFANDVFNQFAKTKTI